MSENMINNTQRAEQAAIACLLWRVCFNREPVSLEQAEQLLKQGCVYVAIESGSYWARFASPLKGGLDHSNAPNL